MDNDKTEAQQPTLDQLKIFLCMIFIAFTLGGGSCIAAMGIMFMALERIDPTVGEGMAVGGGIAAAVGLLLSLGGLFGKLPGQTRGISDGEKSSLIEQRSPQTSNNR